MRRGLMVFFSRDSLPKIKDEVYVINLDDRQSKGTHWVSLFIDTSAAVYFDCFRIEHTAQVVSSKVINKSITHSIFRIQSEDSVMCRFMADSINVLLW